MIGVDISDRSIKIAEVLGSPPRLGSVCWSSLPSGSIRRGVVQDLAGVVGAVQGAFQRCSPVPVSGREVVASIPEIRSFVRVLDLPIMSESETDEAVQWAVRQHIPFDLDRVYLDWQRLITASTPNRQAVLVGVVQRDVVDPLLEALEAAGLQVVALELEAQAIVRSLLPPQAIDIQGVLIVDLGATSTNVIYFNGGALRSTSSVQIGGDDLTSRLAEALHLQPSVAAEQKALVGVSGTGDQSVATQLRTVTLELVRRVQKVLQPAQEVRTILLTGGSANLPGIQEVFAEVFPGIPIQLGNPWTNLQREGSSAPPLSPQDASHFATALGLALRVPQDI